MHVSVGRKGVSHRGWVDELNTPATGPNSESLQRLWFSNRMKECGKLWESLWIALKMVGEG